MISIQLNPRHLAYAMQVLDPKQVRQAMRSAVTTAVKRGRTLIRKEVQQEVKIKTEAFNDAVKVQTGATDSGVTGNIRVTHKGIPLSKFSSVRQTRKGVIANVWKKRPAQVIPWAFKTKLRSGHVGYFARKSKQQKNALPIRNIHGPTIHGEVSKRVVSDKIVKAIQQTVEVRFLSQFKRFGVPVPPDVPGLSAA